MILIADSGSTKTDWCVVEKGKLIQQISTKGTNPFFQSEEEISNEIATALLPQLTTNAFDAVYFRCGWASPQNCHGTPCNIQHLRAGKHVRIYFHFVARNLEMLDNGRCTMAILSGKPQPAP